MKVKIIVAIFVLIAIICIIGWFVYKYMFLLVNKQPFQNVWVDKNRTGTTYKEVIKNMILKVQRFLQRKGIVIVPMYGTLLGLVRHKGLIPWDDDVDICIEKKYYDTLLASEKELEDMDIGIVRNDDYIKLYDLTEPKIKNTGWSWPFIDVYAYEIKPDKVVIANDPSIFGARSYTVDIDDFLPLKYGMFEGIKLPIPRKSEKLLNMLYGKTWKETCVSSSFNHRKEKGYDKTYTINCEQTKMVIDPSYLLENTWVINLDRRPDRWKTSMQRLKKIGIHAKRFKAVDAKDPKFSQFYDKLESPKRSSGEVACYLSHKNLWKHIYNQQIPYALIFEDDLIFPPGIGLKDITDAVIESIGFDILLLGHCGSTNMFFWEYRFDNPNTRPASAQCLHAYVITRNAIEKILHQQDNYAFEIDRVTQKFCDSNMCYISRHVPCENTFGSGIIHQDVGLGSNLTNKGDN